MAAITLDGRQELVALYLTMFDRAPTTIELAQMVVARENGSTLVQVAASLATNDDFALVASKDADSFATYLADALLASDTPAAARTWAINWVVTNVQGAKSKSQVIAEAVQAIRATTNTNYTTAKAILTADVDIALTAIDNPVVPGQVYTLSTSATDVVSGASSSDTIIGQLGQSITLQASDNINGGGGADIFRVVSDGAAAQAAGGFSVINVETLEVQAQAVGGTTLSLENVTGVTTIRSSSSNGALTLDQVKSIAALEVVGALGKQALTVNYQNAATQGTADVQSLSLNGNALGALTIGGVETLAVSTNTAASTVDSVAGGALKTITVAGDKTLTVTAALPATVTSVDASAQTAGGTKVMLTNAADVAVKGGAGNDTATFTAAFTSADSFDGGAGTDTIVANVGEFTASSYAAAAKISNVEVIQFADALGADFDASKIAGENTYSVKTFAGPVTISKADDSSTLTIRENGSTGTLNYSITGATDTGTANTVTLNVGSAGTNGGAIGTVDLSGVETVKIGSSGSTTTVGGNTLTVVDTAATSVTITGSEDLTLTMTGTALTSLDASAATGGVDAALVTFKAATAATITGGAGADKFNGSAAGDTINGGAGADAIAGGAGADNLTGGAGIDTFFYSAVGDSSGSTQDTITDFVSGTDLINLQTLAQSVGRTNIVLKNGAATDFGNAQSSIALNSGNTQVVFQADTNTLWVDLNDDGTLNNNDLAVKMTGVTKLVAADIGGTSSPGGTGNFITLSAANAVVNATDPATNANAPATAFGDSIKSTLANLAGATIDGLAGTDTLVLDDAGDASALFTANVKGLESITLNSGGSKVGGFDDAGSFKNITGGAGADEITSTANLIESGTISLGDGNDSITSLVVFETATPTDDSVKFNIDMGAGNDQVTTGAALLTLTTNSTLAGGAGTDTLTIDNAGASLKDGNVSGFENVTNGTGTLTVKVAQFNAFTGTVVNGGTIVMSDSGTLTIKSAGIFTLGAAANTVTVATGATGTITGGAGNDSFTATAANAALATDVNGAGGTDTYTLTAFTANTDLSTKASNIENITLQGTGGAAVSLTTTGAAANDTLVGAVTIDASALTSGMTWVTGDLDKATVTSYTFKGGAGIDTITRTAASDAAGTFNIGNGDVVAVDTNTVVDTYNITATSTGTTSVTITSSSGTNFDDVIKLFNSAGTQVNVAGFVNDGAAFSGGGVVSARAHDDGTDTVVQIDLNGDGLLGANDVQITLLGVTDTTAGEGNVNFGISSGALTIL